ncbi:hypothetical protein [Winogradskyella flava]|uniref:hypothetical protein n=1 Tax=Winogradskyella flava TaxID=1884876 RepID=UPI00249152F2|nr:hypothetical protein [Winogradskyella flava]
MKLKISIVFFSCLFVFNLVANAQDIPIEYLDMEAENNQSKYFKNVLENEIKGVEVIHETITDGLAENVSIDKNYKTIYLFIKGNGLLETKSKTYNIVPETIFLPNVVEGLSFKPVKSDTLHYIKISVLQTEQDKIDLKEFPKEHTEAIYFAKFTDCEAYTEAIKSPQTTSRTILPNKYIPRVAMGTVETIGPDKVGAHEHPMLEQLFLGLTTNETIVYADDARINFPEYSILHIPLGSSHSVEVKESSKMYYVWMDFFRDKKGEEWLKTHKKKDDN